MKVTRIDGINEIEPMHGSSCLLIQFVGFCECVCLLCSSTQVGLLHYNILSLQSNLVGWHDVNMDSVTKTLALAVLLDSVNVACI